MKNAPFSMSIPFLAIIIFAAIVGAILGKIFQGMNVDYLIAGTLCGFAPIPLAGKIRELLAKQFAKISGVAGKPPFAYSLVIRLLIGAVLAFLAALITYNFLDEPMGAIAGMMIALLTSVAMSITMAAKVMFGD